MQAQTTPHEEDAAEIDFSKTTDGKFQTSRDTQAAGLSGRQHLS
jgi:hypothetical protein